MAQDKVHIPSGMGGLTRYDSEEQSKFVLSPGTVVVGIILIIVIILALEILLKVGI